MEGLGQATADCDAGRAAEGLPDQVQPFSLSVAACARIGNSERWHWKLENIEGRGVNDSTIVKLPWRGDHAATGCDVELNIDAKDVPLDDKLKLALPQPAGSKPGTNCGRRAALTSAPCDEAGRIRWSQSLRLVAAAGEDGVARAADVSVSIGASGGHGRLPHGRVDCQKIVADHDRTIYSAESGVWQVCARRWLAVRLVECECRPLDWRTVICSARCRRQLQSTRRAAAAERHVRPVQQLT